jgi:hypothetical protein
MTEETADYNVDLEPGVIRPSCLRSFDDPQYTQPLPSEVKTLIQQLDMSGNQVALFVGVATGRTVRKWQADINTQNNNHIPYAAWRLLLIRAGLITLEDL